MPRPTAIDAANKFRADLTNQEAQSAERMATIYARIYQNLRKDAASLAEEIALLDPPSRGKIMRLARVEMLLEQVKQQVTKFGGVVEGELTVITSQATQQGIDNAIALMTASLPPDLPPEIQRALVASFARLPADAVEAAAGLMSEQSPLRQQLTEKYGQWTAEQVERHLTDGIAAGMNPRRIAAMLERNLQEGLGSGLTSALSTIRTAQMSAYRVSNHATYQANSNIIKGWYWHADIESGRTCLSCVAMHGSFHELSETLDDHWNGRCAAIPATVSYQDLGLDIPEEPFEIESGEDWFNRQSEARQREMMGPSMWDAWNSGAFSFQELSKKVDDPVFGPMRQEASLSGILGDDSEKYKKR